MIDKKEEKDFEFYMHICVFAYIEFMHLVFLRRIFLKVYTKRGRKFFEKELLIHACFSHPIGAYMFV